jgi:hypothetical protein
VTALPAIVAFMVLALLVTLTALQTISQKNLDAWKGRGEKHVIGEEDQTRFCVTTW